MIYKWSFIDHFGSGTVPCLLCDAPTTHATGLCPLCLAELPRVEHPCPRCGAALSTRTALPCGRCQRHPPAFDTLISATAWAPPVDRFIFELKFHERLAHARLLGELLCAASAATDPPEALLPVPLHPARLRQRGFNQAVEIARFVARGRKLPIDRYSVKRIRHTPPQRELPAVQRRRNLRGAFALARPIPWQHVAIVDDVVTTGSTVHTLAALLKQAGVARVEVWAVARA